MKRSAFKKMILLSLVVVIAFLFVVVIKKITHESSVKSEQQHLADFALIESDGNHTNSTSVCSGTTVLILFNSTCEHCQAEITQLKTYSKQFKKNNVVLISTEPLETINTFVHDLKLDTENHFRCYQISQDDLYNHFGTVSYPEIYIYKDFNLVNHHKGETKPEVILKSL
jgi:cytochrome oxidase Cu insertion factor (SCO1/SenC/PrrC family)